MVISFLSACSSAQKKEVPVIDEPVVTTSMTVTESGDEIADAAAVFVEKRLVAVSDGKPKEYEYVLNEKVIAKKH
jgi:hypothetical protein